MQFPREAPSGNGIPEFARMVGCAFQKGIAWGTVIRDPPGTEEGGPFWVSAVGYFSVMQDARRSQYVSPVKS